MKDRDALIESIRTTIEAAQRPLFLFDDDPDGTTSFALLYKHVQEGKGIVVKASPKVTDMYVSKVEEYTPDLIVILDKPMVDDEFFDQVKIKTIWIDHHQPQNPEYDHVTYFNPRNYDDEDNRPTCYWSFQIAGTDKNLWIAMTGCAGDYFYPEFADEFRNEYPDLLPKECDTPAKVLFESSVGKLARVISFNLKGKISDAMEFVKAFTRIENPQEILEETTPRGKWIMKRFNKVNNEYQKILNEAVKEAEKGEPILIYRYRADNNSFSSELSNELLYKFPDTFSLIGREKGGQVKCSLRSTSIDIPPILEQALEGLDGYGGGHKHACGACISSEDFDLFVERIKEQLQ